MLMRSTRAKKLSSLAFVSLITLAKAVPRATSSGNCVGSISSLDDVSAAVQCKTVNINAFEVPPGKTFSLDLLQGTTVNVLGEIQFGNLSHSGPLFEVIGEDITFHGNGHIWNGGGPFYWDGKGGNGGVAKPSPMMNIGISGTLSNVHVVNSPASCFALNNPGPLVVTGVTVDNSQGNYPNDRSNGLPAGRNTDGFDVAADDIVIRNSVVINQDDCLAINRGKNIVFENNYCAYGHGASIGSISSNVVVENIRFISNEFVNSTQAIRIKTDQFAKNSLVTNVTYSGNVARDCTSYAVVITQSYPKAPGAPGNGVIISDVNFNPDPTEISVVSGAKTVVIDCGEGSCAGYWDWSALHTFGGERGETNNMPKISGYNL